MGCADDSQGDDEVGGETETNGDGAELEPVECAAPCAIAQVRVENRLYYHLWAIELDDPGEPKVLLEGSLFELSLRGPTPWGTLAVYSRGFESGMTMQLDIDGQGEVVAEPLLPPDVSGDFVHWQFSGDQQLAVMHGGVDEQLTGNRLWGARFIDGSVVASAPLDPQKLDDEVEFVSEAILADDGSAVAFRRVDDFGARLHVARLEPDFGEPIQLTSDSDVVESFVWSGDRIVATVHAIDSADHRVDVWTLADPIAAPLTLVDGVEPNLEGAGNLVGYFVGPGNFVVADVDTGDDAPVPFADVRGQTWLRDDTVLLAVGDAQALVMVEFTGVVAGDPMPITDVLEDGVVGDPRCDSEGHWCGYTVEIGTSKRVEFVDVSGSVPMPTNVVLEGIAADELVTIDFAGATHATVSRDHDTLYVVDLAISPLGATLIEAPNGDPEVQLAAFDPDSHRLLFTSRDADGEHEFLWRGRADGSNIEQVTFASGWVFEGVEVLE